MDEIKVKFEIAEILAREEKTLLDMSKKLTDIFDILKKQLSIHGVIKRFSEEQMIEASKYGYNYRDTTSFPNKNFDDNCKNNTRQWLTTLK